MKKLVVRYILISFIFALAANHSYSSEVHAPLTECPKVENEIVDLHALAEELRKTKSISIFKKNGLKNDIYKFIDSVKRYHDGETKYSLQQLQTHYNLLLMKIAAMTDNKDPKLHQKICNAWEVIWSDLEDPQKFKALAT